MKKTITLFLLISLGMSLFAYPYKVNNGKIDVDAGQGTIIHRFEGEYAEEFAKEFIEKAPEQVAYLLSLEQSLTKEGLIEKKDSYDEKGVKIIPWSIKWNESELFYFAFINSDYKKVEEILSSWESKNPEDPEMLIAYFNYYLNRDYNSVISIGQMKDGTYGLYNQEDFKIEDVKTGITYLDKALLKNPNRLDIHFGKCSSLIRTGLYEEASKAIINMLDASKKNKNKWTWTNGAPLEEDGEEVLFSGINDYNSMLFSDFANSKDYLKNVIEKIEKTYPKNIIGLNHCARYYSQTGNNKKAITLLKKATSLDKNDYIVLSNLGYLYEMENNFTEARKCYETMSKMSNPEAQQLAQQYLEEIKDK